MDLTREQENKAEEVSARYGRCAVLPANTGDGSVILVGMTDDVERCHLMVPPHGYARAATAAELRRTARLEDAS